METETTEIETTETEKDVEKKIYKIFETIKEKVANKTESVKDIFECYLWCKMIIGDWSFNDDDVYIIKKYIIDDQFKQFFVKINNIYNNIRTEDGQIEFKNSKGKSWYLVLKKPDKIREAIKQYKFLYAKYQANLEKDKPYSLPYSNMIYIDLLGNDKQQLDRKELDKEADDALDSLAEPLYLLFLMSLKLLHDKERDDIAKETAPSL